MRLRAVVIIVVKCDSRGDIRSVRVNMHSNSSYDDYVHV